MKFSIILPSWNNLKYLMLCLDSIKKNSKYEHDINVHLNVGSDGSVEYLEKNGIKFNRSIENLGLCRGANSAASLAETNYIIYAHDDMYFLPNWDFFLADEVKETKNDLYYLSGTMIGPIGCGLQNIDFSCGKTADEFNEKKLLSNYQNVKYFDHQGTHWAPHLIHKSVWERIGGFSEEFDPGFASDVDLNMKLWREGVRVFKGIDNSRVYHFGSISLRKKTELIKNKGNRSFLKKWGISSELFIKFYLRSNTPYDGPLNDKPKINIEYLIEFLRCKIKLFILKFFKL